MTDPSFYSWALGTSLTMMAGGLVARPDWSPHWWIRHGTVLALLLAGRFLQSLHG